MTIWKVFLCLLCERSQAASKRTAYQILSLSGRNMSGYAKVVVNTDVKVYLQNISFSV